MVGDEKEHDMTTNDAVPAQQPSTLTRLMAWFAKKMPGRAEDQSLRESIETVIGGHEATEELGPQARHMLMNILSFAEQRVDDVMVPPRGHCGCRHFGLSGRPAVADKRQGAFSTPCLS